MLKQHLKLFVYPVVGLMISSPQVWASDDFFRSVMADNAGAISTHFLRGTSPNVRNDKGQLALIVALQEGNQRAIAALLTHPDIQIDLANQSGETALMMAALKGELAWLRELLARGAQVTREGWTPLHYASAGPAVAAVNLLLAQNAPLNARSPNGTTPLMMAARYGSIDTAELLLKRGADARLRNEQGLNAAEFARLAGRDKLTQTLEEASR